MMIWDIEVTGCRESRLALLPPPPSELSRLFGLARAGLSSYLCRLCVTCVHPVLSIVSRSPG
jgi:hypothetical protein